MCVLADINECALNSTNKCSKDFARCTNLQPSSINGPGYSCSCNDGYTGDGFVCTGESIFYLMCIVILH